MFLCKKKTELILVLHRLASSRSCSCVWTLSSSLLSSGIGNIEDEDSLEGSTGNSSERHSLRRKLWSVAHANTSYACVLNKNGGADLKIVKRDLKIPNNLSTTFLKDACRRLNNSFSFSGSLPWPAKSCRWYRTPRCGAKNWRRLANPQSTRKYLPN